MPAKKIIKKKLVSKTKVSSARSPKKVALRSPRAKAPRASVSLSASVYDVKGKAVGRITLPSEIFGVEENKHLIAQAVRVYLANQRQGTVSMKTRGEVKGSTRKIYKQKGTGRARHGANRAPIFVHGGVTFATKPKDFSLSLPQKMKRKALFSALSGKLKDGEIKIMDLDKIQPKTKVMAKAIEAMAIGEKILLVTPGGFKEFGNVYKASRNLKGMKISPAVSLNTYDVLDTNAVVFMKEAVDVLKKHFLEAK
ncbi:MAG TPA: 50S ribosomal protein L4 [Patescibacteria group bacterium]|nr:50S ribosomal protein L4 [Patescibacteria group bacterium]